jgi:integrase
MSNTLELIPKNESVLKQYDIVHMFELFLKLHGPYAVNTIKNKTDMFAKLIKFLDGRMPTKELMLEWSLTLTMGVAKYNQIVTTAHQVLRWMHKVGYLPEDLTRVIPWKRQPPPKPSQIWTHEEYEKIKAYCRPRPNYQAHLFLIILGYRTGMSLVDCCHLRWRDVHLHDNGPSFIDIYRIKTERLGGKAFCQIPVLPFTDLHEALIARKKVEHLNYKRFDGITDFVHEDAPGLYINTMWKINEDFRDIFRRCGINWNGTKTFRHFRNTFVSNLVNSGMQLALLTKVTGHNNLKTLMLYLKADRYALQEGIAKAYEYSERDYTAPTAPVLAPNPETGIAQVG